MGAVLDAISCPRGMLRQLTYAQKDAIFVSVSIGVITDEYGRFSSMGTAVL